MTWYTGDSVYDTVLTVGFAFAAFVAISALFVQSPYGRFASEKLGVSLDPRLGWWLMELPATVVFLVFFALGERHDVVPMVFAAIWCIHYANRGWFFPLTIRTTPGQKGSFSITVVLAGWFVTGMHGFLNAQWFTDFGDHLTTEWLTDPRFLVGLAVYYSGYFLVLHSERVVRTLRDTPGPRYRIPFGGGFKLVTNPAYLGELVGWAGFALMTWSLAGVLIFCISAANLIPRAFQNHRWYLEKFDDYPKDRKVLVPYVL